VEAGEGDEVYSELAKISVELARESKAAGDTRHGGGHKMIKVTIGRGGELEGAEADVVEGFIVEAEALIGVFYKLMDTKGGVVGFYNCVGNFW